MSELASPIRVIRRRLQRLKADRATWDAHWKDLRDHLSPWSGNFADEGERANDGGKKADPIESAGREALRVMASGMQGGLTPRSVRWFGLKTREPGARDIPGVGAWLDECAQLILDILARSNFYHVQSQVYESLGLFGTAAMYMEDDFDTVVRFKFLSAGEYWIADNWKGEVDTLIRVFQVTARNVVKEFGEENCSASVRNLAGENPDQYVKLVHAVLPRPDGRADALNPKALPFASYYFEEGAGDDAPLLRESGYRSFPFLVPRWQVRGSDAYGHSPAMDALGDVKMAREMLIDVVGMVNNITHPPLQAPQGVEMSGVNMDAGTVTYVADMRQGEIKPILTTEYNVQNVQAIVREVEEKIRRAFHHDIFMMFAGDDKTMTATEIMERRQERLTQLGPVLERMQTEIFGPLIERIYERCATADILPPVPEGLPPGTGIEVEYTSALSQAQNLSRVTNMQQFVGQLGQVAQVKPEVLDLLDEDSLTRRFAEYLNVPPDILRERDEVEALRRARAEQQQAMQQQQQAMQAVSAAADVARTAGDINMDENTALTQLMGAMGGGA